MSTTFMGRSSPEEDLWRHTPRSADPKSIEQTHTTRTCVPGIMILVFLYAYDGFHVLIRYSEAQLREGVKEGERKGGRGGSEGGRE